MRIGFAGLDVTLFITKFLLSQEFFFPPQLRDGGDSPEAPLHFLSFFLSSSFASIPSPSRRAPTHCSFFLSFFLQCFFNGSFRFGAFRSSPFHLCTAHNGPSNIQVLMQGGTAGHNPWPSLLLNAVQMRELQRWKLLAPSLGISVASVYIDSIALQRETNNKERTQRNK